MESKKTGGDTGQDRDLFPVLRGSYAGLDQIGGPRLRITCGPPAACS